MTKRVAIGFGTLIALVVIIRYFPNITPSGPQQPVGTSASVTTTQQPQIENASAQISDAEALDLLSRIPVKGRAPKTGYSRDRFGQRWADIDHNGCDTRNDILRRDLTNVVVDPDTDDCVVTSGSLLDPYGGKEIRFVKGKDTSAAVQIDHIVALSNAWQTGAQALTDEQRTEFANDPLNLLAVDGSLNTQKGDGDAATWLPPRKDFRRIYLARQIQVKAKYGLWMTEAEKTAITKVITSAPQEPRAEEQSASANSKETTPPPDGSGVYYKNCAAARRAGKAPIHIGEPGYRPEMDGDHDGIACEG